ncbi:MAG TPA: hypothetical protein VFL70_04240 [Bacteroidia bacterium]|nr:hypothetical protein [Bacteroidia bacterium]
MTDFIKTYGNEQSIVYFLLLSIAVFIVSIVILVILLFIGRFKKIRGQDLINTYNPIINEILFPIVFSDLPIPQIIKSTNYKNYVERKEFQNILLKSVVKLHINYSGDCNIRLEDFYKQFGLVRLSYDKLKSSALNIQCEGIRELSEMNIKEAYSYILQFIWHKNTTLKLEALIGMIRLKGLNGLIAITDYPEPINDWIQLNLLYEINNFYKTSDSDFTYFLTSANESLVVFGLRLMEVFNQSRNIDMIKKIHDSVNSNKIRRQANRTLAKLASLDING